MERQNSALYRNRRERDRCTTLNRNSGPPFTVKKCVAQACVLTSIVYGSETWFTDNYGKAETTYNKIVKSLLDVRQTTCTELCFVEAGMSSFKALVHEKMRKYVQKKFPNIETDHPLKMAFELNRSVDTKAYRRINELLGENTDLKKKDIETRNDALRQSLSTKRALYCKINPQLESPELYKNNDIKEFQRIQVTISFVLA